MELVKGNRRMINARKFGKREKEYAGSIDKDRRWRERERKVYNVR